MKTTVVLAILLLARPVWSFIDAKRRQRHMAEV
jgi:hypothetical protein